MNLLLNVFLEEVNVHETLSKRIETYRENSKPILDYYRNKGILMTVDASAHPERVVEEAQMEI